MGYRYKSNDGLVRSNDVSFIENWNKIGEEMALSEKEWISKLRSEGVKAAHPDDGWVKRDKNVVGFCYPQFNDGVNVDDIIVLGWYWEYRYVKVTEIIDGFSLDKYKFEPIETEQPKKRVSFWKRLLSSVE